MRGRKPTPTATRQASGDTRKIGAHKLLELGQSEPQPAKGAPECPRGLSKGGRAEWERVVPELSATPGLLAVIDGDALAAYCEDMAVLRRLRKAHEEAGDVVQGPSGPTLNPLMRQIDVLETRCIRHRSEFGMTPAARPRIHVDPKDNEPQDLVALLSAPRTPRPAVQ